MSTDYGVCCLDCNDALILDENRSPQAAADLVAMAPRLATLRGELKDAQIEVAVGCGRRVDLSWFETHGTHRLDVVDEYGGRWPRCRRSFKKEGETFLSYCKRKDGHPDDEPCTDESPLWRS